MKNATHSHHLGLYSTLVRVVIPGPRNSSPTRTYLPDALRDDVGMPRREERVSWEKYR